MHTFRDTEGREWLVQVNVAAIKRVRALIGVDLLALVDDGFRNFGKFMGDPIALVDTLYCLCKPEADAKGISDIQFGEAMAGDVIGSASDAFLAAFTDFFPDPRARESLARVIAAGRTMTDRLMEHQASQLASLDPEAEARKFIASSGGSPGSSASTPDPSPSESST
jgi:hypothetical protein